MNSESYDYGKLLELGLEINLIAYDEMALAGCYTYRLFRLLRLTMRDVLNDRVCLIHLPCQPDSSCIVHLSEKRGCLIQHNIEVVCMPAYVRDAYQEYGGKLVGDDVELVIAEGFNGNILLGSY